MIEIPIGLKKESFRFILLQEKNKIPIEKEWQVKNNYAYNDIKLLNHLNKNGNYGVLCNNELIVIDADTERLNEIVLDKLNKTFSVKTKKGYHYYFLCADFTQKKVLSDKGEHLGEIQSVGSFVVGANSIHPSGVVYEVVNNVEIERIEKEKINDVLGKYYSSDKITKEVILSGAEAGLRNDSMFRLACSFREKDLSQEETLSALRGINDKNTPPLPSSELKGIVESAFKYKKEKKQYYPILHNYTQKKQIQIPMLGKSISTFIKEIIPSLKESNKLYYRRDTRDVVEVGDVEYKDINEQEKNFIGFLPIKSERFITLLEQIFETGFMSFDDKTKQHYFREKTLGVGAVNIILASELIEKGLFNIKRIFSIPCPIKNNGNITFPNKGYDERFSSWLPHNAPEIEQPNMSVDQGKEVIKKVLSEFAFETESDYKIAISSLITPFLRGLYGSWYSRTPVFIYMANRERVGKDYLAGVISIIYEGVFIEDSPISRGGNISNNEDELRKKITSSFIMGRKRLHFSNNKGFINNGVFEGIVTTTTYSDRLLGKNNLVIFGNDLEFSLSCNIGVTFTPDLIKRSRLIKLFYGEENINKRKFENPQLHKWVTDNRGLILSAIYSLIKNWFDQGCVEGSVPFTSFPEWARVCGGIMESAGYGSPCDEQQNLVIGGDTNTENMKRLFEICYTISPNKYLTKGEIKEILKKDEYNDLFAWVDWEKKSDQTKFGNILTTYINRIMSDIIMRVEDSSQRSARQRVGFFSTKAKASIPFWSPKNEVTTFLSSEAGNLGNLHTTPNPFQNKKYKGVEKSYQGYQGYQKTLDWVKNYLFLLNPQKAGVDELLLKSKEQNILLTDELLQKGCFEGLWFGYEQGFINLL